MWKVRRGRDKHWKIQALSVLRALGVSAFLPKKVTVSQSRSLNISRSSVPSFCCLNLNKKEFKQAQLTVTCTCALKDLKIVSRKSLNIPLLKQLLLSPKAKTQNYVTYLLLMQYGQTRRNVALMSNRVHAKLLQAAYQPGSLMSYSTI